MFVFFFLVAALHQLPDLSQPFVEPVAAALDALVGPVGGAALFGVVIHPRGPDLHLDGHSFLRLHGRMERFVAVVTRLGDPVAEPAGVGFVFFRDQGIDLPAECLLDFMDRFAIDDEAHGEQVVYLVEADLLLLHLLPDGVGTLGAGFQGVLDAFAVQLVLERVDEVPNQRFALRFRVLDLAHDLLVALRLGEFEEDVLHLALDAVHAQLVGERDIEHHGFHELLHALGGRQDADAAHYLEAVRQLDQDHARIGGVGDDELAVALFIEIGLLQLDVRDVVEALDDLDDVVGILRPEGFQQRGMVEFAGLACLEAVRFVEQGGYHGIGAQADLPTEDMGDGKRMFDEGMAVAAHLAPQGLLCGFISREYHPFLLVREEGQDIL